MADWRYLLTDLTGGDLGEAIGAAGRRCARPLNGLPTAGFTVPLEHPVADTIVGATPLERLNLLVKVYRDDVLMLCGPIAGAEEAVDAGGVGTLAVTAAGPLWRLFRRLVGLTVAGYGDGTPLVPKDLGQIAANLITTVNGGGDTGIRVGTIDPSSSSYVGPWYFKKVAEGIMEIGPGVLGGFDFDLAPNEPVVDGFGTKIATFNAGPFIGVERGDAVFEFGIGLHNIASYRRPFNVEGLANKVYHLAPGFPDSIDAAHTPVIVALDAASIAARLLHEDVVTADLGPNILRQQLADEHVAIRKVPRELILFTPTVDAEPQYGADYVEGDLVPARAVYNDVVRFDALFRIYGADFTIGDDNSETVELTLVNES